MLTIRRLAFALIMIGSSSPLHAQEKLVGSELNRFLARWSAGPIRSSDVRELYAPRVRYYGRELSQDQVTREKASIARKWPNRRYAIVPRTLQHRCTADRSRCMVTGVMRWMVKDGRGRGSSGASSLTLDMRQAGAGYQIVAESGSVIAKGGPVR